MGLKLLRLTEVCARKGLRPTRIYQDIKDGLFTPPLKKGRNSFWPESEVDALIAYQIAGKDDEDLRTLVRELVAERKQAVHKLDRRGRGRSTTSEATA